MPAIGFKTFIAYDDLDAARGAMKAINEVLRASNHRYDFQPMLWRFDQLCSDKWRDPSLADAVDAEVVVLASSAAGPLTSFVERWVGQFLARKRNGGRTTLVALLGNEESWTISIEAPRPVQVPIAATAEFPTREPAAVTKAA